MESTFNVSKEVNPVVRKFNKGVLSFYEQLAPDLGVEKAPTIVKDRNGAIEKVVFPKGNKMIYFFPSTYGTFDCTLTSEESSVAKEFKNQIPKKFLKKEKGGALAAMLDFFNME